MPFWPEGVEGVQEGSLLNGLHFDYPNSIRTDALAVNNLKQIVGEFNNSGIGIVLTDVTDFVLLYFLDTTPLPIILSGMR